MSSNPIRPTVACSASEAAEPAVLAAAAERAGDSARLARAAVDEAMRAAALARELNALGARIGDVVAMIAALATRSHLPVLHAAIAAARAGDDAEVSRVPAAVRAA